MKIETKIIVFGGGCFWCTEATFTQLRGVVSVVSGYAGGTTSNPTYNEVCSGTTGHAEVIKVEYDQSQITLPDLLNVFFVIHDPTTPNRQGNDIGTQYRSIILYTNKEQSETISQFINNLIREKIFTKPIVTEIKELGVFYEAEEMHQKYYERNSDQAYCQVVINPKLKKLRSKYTKLLK